uniref:Putative determination of adult lifespan n=1 Tax=Corethrella appendiculata TaxID=1370023 RepID=U5ES18_9DIPT
MSLQEKFDKAAEDVKKLKTTPSNDQLLELYGLFKQATVGDNTTAKPGLLDFKGKAKWEAWEGRKGTTKDSAMEQYVALAEKLIAEIGL